MMKDEDFIMFMHSGSPLWVNKGFKDIEDYKLTGVTLLNNNISDEKNDDRLRKVDAIA